MIGALGRTWVCAAVVASAVSLALSASGALAASGTAALVCSTRTLRPPGQSTSLRVVTLEADGLGCATARSIARHVAQELGRGASLSFTNASGISISEQSCGACVSKTEVSITYARGTIRVSLAGPRSAPGGGSHVITA